MLIHCLWGSAGSPGTLVALAVGKGYSTVSNAETRSHALRVFIFVLFAIAVIVLLYKYIINKIH